MNKPSKVIRVRNEQIRTRFGECLKQGMPIMMIYAKLTWEFDLSEVHIRRVVRG